MKKEIQVGPYVKGDGVAVSGHSKKVDIKGSGPKNSNPNKSSLLNIKTAISLEAEEDLVIGAGSYVSGRTIAGMSFAGKDISKTHFVNCQFQNCDFTNTNLKGSSFVSVQFSDCTMNEASFLDSSMEKVDIVGGSLNDANLSGSSWNSVSFKYTKMQHVDLRGAVLRKVVLSGVDIRGANWSGADFNVQELIASSIPCDYDQYDFYEAIEEMKLSEKQFEYFVVSGAMEIRDDLSQERVSSGFDPSTQHVPAWQVHNPQWLQ